MEKFKGKDSVNRQYVTVTDEGFMHNLTKSEALFLKTIWWPIAVHDEEIWKSEYPIGQVGSSQSVTGFWFTQDGARLLIEISELRSEQLSSQEHYEYMQLQNELMLAGWHVLRLNIVQLENDPAACQRLLRQALNFAQEQRVSTVYPAPQDLWKIRKQQIIEIAKRHNGKIRPREVAAEFNVNIRSAAEWLMQFSIEGMFSFVSGPKLAKFYILNENGH
ncbi:hypothetical protein [Paenibacillus sedimenti]|uniref:Uncharacterized protein n=1 Tax=Paenibacillus sedimenti TaxID=2770274 RepID=A0A926KLX3_9BACL|nr:hypothetical protein [Paenibacillus sedimenti]MBD0379717.1 hypothetical protein [Paenibacillus sedimenti]